MDKDVKKEKFLKPLGLSDMNSGKMYGELDADTVLYGNMHSRRLSMSDVFSITGIVLVRGASLQHAGSRM